MYDAKTMKAFDAKTSVASSKDPNHPKALEVVIDHARPGGWPRIVKVVQQGTLDPRKSSGIRFWIRSDNDTKLVVQISGDHKRSDNKSSWFYSPEVQGAKEWKQVVIPYDSFKRANEDRFENGKKVTIRGGDAPDAEDFPQLAYIGFRSNIERRGTDGTSQFMVHKLELIEK